MIPDDPRILRQAELGRLPVGGPTEWRAFELATSLYAWSGMPAGLMLLKTAWAWPRYWDGSRWTTQVEEKLRFQVWDPLAFERGPWGIKPYPRLTGRGRDTFPPPHDSGSVGLCYRWPDNRRWEIYAITPTAELVAGDYLRWTYGPGGYGPHLVDVEVVAPAGAILPFFDPAGPVPVAGDLFGDLATNARATAILQLPDPASTLPGKIWQLLWPRPVPLYWRSPV